LRAVGAAADKSAGLCCRTADVPACWCLSSNRTPLNRPPSPFGLRWTAFARRLARQPSLARVSGERRRSACAPWALRRDIAPARALITGAPRRMERGTGIEPATNSLGGCDSTTGLLPPTHSLTPPPRAPSGLPADVRHSAHAPLRPPPTSNNWVNRSCPPPRFARRGQPPTAHARWLANRRSRSERRLVAREGLEPSKPLGRQIYSLLRLTASL